MGALADFVDEIKSDLTSFGVKQGKTAWLTNAVSSTADTWTIDAGGFASEGVAEVDNEQVYFRRFDSQNNVAVIAPDGRGWNGTTAAAHAANSRITLEPRFPRKNVEAAINRTILRCFPTIWGIRDVDITITGGVATYALPASTEAVAMVTSETLGPSGIWYPINVYSFDGGANKDVYPTGKTVTIPGPGTFPGRTVQVTTRVRPTELTRLSLNFTDCGLSESAKAAVRLGTLADLMRTADPQRLTTHSAAADEYDTKRAYGTATKIANDLEAQFIRELDAELGRLRSVNPATIHRKAYA